MVTRFLVTIVFVLALSFAPLRTVRADTWGANLIAVMVQQMMERIQRSIEGVMLGSLKLAATQMLNSQVGQLVGGASVGQALFITDFNDFLYQGPKQRAELYMNDFFTLTTRGQSSSANYVAVGDSGGIGGNYQSYLVSAAKEATIESGGPKTYDLDQYTANPETMFAEGDFRAFNAFFSNPANNPYGYVLEAEGAYQGKLAMEREIAVTKAQSSGFLPSEQNGMVTTPAAAIEGLVTSVQNIPNQIIAAAQNPGELLSGVITGMANKMINNLVQKGIGQIQANIQREIGNVTSQINSQLGQISSITGPGGLSLGNLQNTASRINPSGPVPPSALSGVCRGACSNDGCRSDETQTSGACGGSGYVCCVPSGQSNSSAVLCRDIGGICESGGCGSGETEADASCGSPNYTCCMPPKYCRDVGGTCVSQGLDCDSGQVDNSLSCGSSSYKCCR